MMKAYGVRKADKGCCACHDKYHPPRFQNHPTNQHGRKAHARQEARKQVEDGVSVYRDLEEDAWFRGVEWDW